MVPISILTIKDWKFTVFVFLWICLFVALGYWQLSRAKQKNDLIQQVERRLSLLPLTETNLAGTGQKDLRFYPVALHGKFEGQHTILLDNKTWHGQVGYEVYVPFVPQGTNYTLLVDRGFVQRGPSRQHLPNLPLADDTVLVTGRFDRPPAYFSFGDINEPGPLQWPLRVQFIHLGQLATLLGRPLFPYVVTISPGHPAACMIGPQGVAKIGPARHKAYALQWFALAFSLLILLVVLNYRGPQGQ